MGEKIDAAAYIVIPVPRENCPEGTADAELIDEMWADPLEVFERAGEEISVVYDDLIARLTRERDEAEKILSDISGQLSDLSKIIARKLVWLASNEAVEEVAEALFLDFCKRVDEQRAAHGNPPFDQTPWGEQPEEECKDNWRAEARAALAVVKRKMEQADD